MDQPGLFEALRQRSVDQEDVIPIRIHPKYQFHPRLIETSAVSNTQDTEATIAVWLKLIEKSTSHIRLFMTEMPYSLRTDNRIVRSLSHFVTQKRLRYVDLIVGNQGTRIVNPDTFEHAKRLIGDALSRSPSGMAQRDPRRVDQWPQERWLTIERTAYWYGAYTRLDDFEGTYCFKGTSRTNELVEAFDKRFLEFLR